MMMTMIVFTQMILMVMTKKTVATKSMMAAAKSTLQFSKKLEVPAKKRKMMMTMNKK